MAWERDVPNIRLERHEWNFDEQDRLGSPGGFGEVFRGRGQIGPVAIKRLMLTAQAAAHRELSIAASLCDRNLANVVPVLDSGQDAESDRYFLVMPICDYSLQDRIDRNETFSWLNIKRAALNIISGLQEVGDLVHRDLKPGNVLWHKDRWCVADFGIAKFVEDSTSLETLRTSLTPLYAAPEQWLGERPTHATDIYALGCMIYTMMAGTPPFIGDSEQVREAHLHSIPPDLIDADPRLRGLLHHMLRKNAVSRPSLDRCATVIGALDDTSRAHRNSALVEAGSIIAQEQAAEEAKRQVEKRAALERTNLAKEASAELRDIFHRLFDAIESNADSAEREADSIRLGPAFLAHTDPVPTNRTQGVGAKSWDTVAFALLRVEGPFAEHSAVGPKGYSFATTLIFCRTPNDDTYRWREVSFFNWNAHRSMGEEPTALTPLTREFDLAFSNIVSGWQLAYGPLDVDGECEEEFQDRWLNLFARAARKQLTPPTSLPIQEQFFRA